MYSEADSCLINLLHAYSFKM